MKTAFVHDWLTGMRGGEKVLEAACELFPEAEIYTLVYRPDRLSDPINKRSIHPSWLDAVPGAHQYYRYFLPLMPLAIGSFDLSDQDLVLSFSHCVAKGARIAGRDGRRPLHICYCHTPMRYIYEQSEHYFHGGSRAWLKRGLALFRPYLARWDRRTASQVDHFIANSENVRRRIQAVYDRDAEVIYPPVDTGLFDLARSAPACKGRGYYLVAGALVPYKRVDLAIEACRRLDAPLKIVGIGTERKRLEKLVGRAPVEFLGWQDPEVLRGLYRDCEALLFPQEEDFGIAAVEAMACGKPVIAYKRGGALEIVQDNKSGVFFDAQTPEALAQAIQKSRQVRFNPEEIREQALKFDREQFKKRFSDFVQKAYSNYKRTPGDRGGHLDGGRPNPDRVHVMQVVECGGPGGTGHQVAAICNGLDKARFDVSLVYSVRPGCSAGDYEVMAHCADRFIHVPDMVREIRPTFDLRAFLRLYRVFKQYQPDVVHAHSSKAGFLARLAAKAAGVRKIYYSPRGYSFLQTDRPGLSRRLYRSLERAASRIGRIVAVSESEAMLARDLDARDVLVVRDAYLGQVPEALPPEGAKQEIVVCAAGRMSHPRNPEAFVRLAQRVTDFRGNVRFLWIGGGELQPMVEGMVRDLNLGDKMRITGWLPHEQAMHSLASADIFVHYSRWEGLPNAVLEAMAYGLPVVASDIPGNRDLIRSGENGFLARAEPDLLERVVELADHPELRRKFGASGQAMVRAQFSVQRMLSELSDLYELGTPTLFP